MRRYTILSPMAVCVCSSGGRKGWSSLLHLNPIFLLRLHLGRIRQKQARLTTCPMTTRIFSGSCAIDLVNAARLMAKFINLGGFQKRDFPVFDARPA